MGLGFRVRVIDVGLGVRDVGLGFRVRVSITFVGVGR